MAALAAVDGPAICNRTTSTICATAASYESLGSFEPPTGDLLPCAGSPTNANHDASSNNTRDTDCNGADDDDYNGDGQELLLMIKNPAFP